MNPDTPLEVIDREGGRLIQLMQLIYGDISKSRGELRYSASSKLLVTLRKARRLYLHANIKLCNCTVIITRKREH